MRLLILNIAVLFCLMQSGTAFAQSDDSDTTVWDIGIYASPDYCSRFAKGSSPGSLSALSFDVIESPCLGFTTGIMFSRQISNRLYIQSGMVVESQGYNTKTRNDTVFDLYDKPLYTSEYSTGTRYYSLNIPVILKVNLFSAGKIKFNLGAGLAPVISLGNHEMRYFGDHTERLVSKAGRDLNVQAIINMSMYVPLSQNFSLSIEPAMKYTILPYNDRSYPGISRSLFAPGLGIFIAYTLPNQAIYDYFYYNIYKKKTIPATF